MDTETADLGIDIPESEPVVVIIGSGAGGGTVAYELATRGIRCVVLEAGPVPGGRRLRERRVGRLQPDGLAGPADHQRLLAGGAGLPEPADLDRQGGRRLDHPLVGRDAAVHGARVPGPHHVRRARRRQPAGLADHAWTILLPTTTRPRSPSARPTGTAARRQPANNNYFVFANGAERAGYRYYATGPVRHQRRAVRRPARPRSRTASTSRATSTARSGRPGSGRSRAPWRPASCDLRPQQPGGQDHPRRAGTVDGVEYLDAEGNLHQQAARVVCVAGNSIESPRLLLMSAIVAAPGRAGQLLGSGRPQLHAAHDRVGVRDLRPAGADVPRRDDGRHHRRRGQARHVPRLRRWLLHGDPRPRAGVPGLLHRAGRVGRGRSPRRWTRTRTPPGCGSSARTCRRTPTGSR